MSKDISEEAIKEFYNLVHQKNQEKLKKEEYDKKIIEEKQKILLPIKKILAKLVEAGIYVDHHSKYDNYLRARNLAPQEFKVWQNTSSPHYSPGYSFYLDDPAKIEIAVPNLKDRKDEGVIKINCSTPHEYQHLLNGPFHTVEEASIALVQFLSKSTVRIDGNTD